MYSPYLKTTLEAKHTIVNAESLLGKEENVLASCGKRI